MNTNRYSLKSFLTDHNLEQIVIPEIQRDYVWREDNVKKLLSSIKEDADRQENVLAGVDQETLSKLPPAAREALSRSIDEGKSYCNVGFLYAYNDPEFPGRFMLIDGQQRITTLFLLLLCLSVKEQKQEQFRRTYFREGTLKVDYKVREHSHEFLVNFVEHMLSGLELRQVEEQYWYFAEYKHDVTIQSICSNYRVISEFLGSHDLSLQYVEDYIEFYYFDTNKSKQGEELYIYMNSRGESVSSGETIKAGLLKGLSDSEKRSWGSRWEVWQNFFWKHSDNNQSADSGLEEFLRW